MTNWSMSKFEDYARPVKYTENRQSSLLGNQERAELDWCNNRGCKCKVYSNEDHYSIVIEYGGSLYVHAECADEYQMMNWTFVQGE